MEGGQGLISFNPYQLSGVGIQVCVNHYYTLGAPCSFAVSTSGGRRKAQPVQEEHTV